MTEEQLLKFVEVRNASPYSSNLQFETDAEECGFSINDLGEPDVWRNGWVWETPYGKLTKNWKFELSLH